MRTGDDGRRYIDQFMWGFQPNFRHALELRAETAFGLIGLAVDPRAVLIGFDESDAHAHAICVEPESGPFRQEDFSGVLERAHGLYEIDDERSVIVTGEGQQERFETSSLDKSRGAALNEALTRSAREENRRYFVGRSRVVADYRVFPVLSVLDSKWSEVPTLPDCETGRTRIANSLPQELIHRLLDLATLSLAVGDNPSEMVAIGRNTARDLVKVAASGFVDGVPIRLGGVPSELLENLDSIASTPYEGRAAMGRILLIPRKSDASVLLGFKSSVRLSATRRARKLLEMSSSERYLVSDGEVALGLTEYPDKGEPVYEVTFAGRGTWTLSWSGVDFLHVDQGQPRLPIPPLDFKLFVDNFDRLFGTCPNADASAVWRLVDVASTQEHGTMLVVHSLAIEEAERLGGQAVPIDAAALNEESLYAASRIDGAILVSPDGLCHAIGVILDGEAGRSGDPGRGARFNSAARYVDGHRASCLILVVSEDGSVEIVPKPRRRVKRSFIQGVVADVIAASEGEVDFENFSRMVDRALAHAFYFDQTQCDSINAARLAVEDVRWRQSSMRITVPKVEPDEWLDDSYFISELE